MPGSPVSNSLSSFENIAVAAMFLVTLTACEATRAVSTATPIPPDAIALTAPESRAAAFDSAVKRFRFYSGLGSRERLVIRGASDWNAMWSTLASGSSPTPAVPEVDFATEMVILASMGSRSTGGYSIEIPGVFEHAGDVFVSVRETSSGRNCFVTQAFTQPVALVLVPSRSGRVVFSEVAVTRDC